MRYLLKCTNMKYSNGSEMDAFLAGDRKKEDQLSQILDLVKG